MKVLCIKGDYNEVFLKKGQIYDSPDWGNGKNFCTIKGQAGWLQDRFVAAEEPLSEKLDKIIELLGDIVENTDDLNEMVMERLSKVTERENHAADAMAYWAASFCTSAVRT